MYDFLIVYWMFVCVVFNLVMNKNQLKIIESDGGEFGLMYVVFLMNVVLGLRGLYKTK